MVSRDVVSFAASLPEAVPELWERATRHPFVTAVGDGTLPVAAFHTWIEQDHRFLHALEGFVRTLASVAPDSDRSGLITAATMLGPEFDLFRGYATSEHLDLEASPYPACLDYTSFLGSVVGDYAHGLTAYYACERSYLEAWKNARALAEDGSPFGSWIENWSSSEFAAFVSWIGERLDAVEKSDTDALVDTFARTVRYEIAFWDACWDGAG